MLWENYIMEEKELWNEVKTMLQDSDRKICIYEGEESAGHLELEGLGLSSLSVLGVVVSYTSGICIDNWIRMLGQSGPGRRGIADYNELGTEEKCSALEGMLVAAQDIVGVPGYELPGVYRMAGARGYPFILSCGQRNVT